MERRYLRNHNPETVTNKFAVGECIEWIDTIWQDEDESFIIKCIAGIIKKITPHTVLIELTCNGKNVRIDKSELIHNAMDDSLKDEIKASVGYDLFPKIKNSIPHDAYRLRDPRDKSIFYVGISKNVQRRYKQHLSCSGLNFKLNIRIQEILQSGLTPELEIIEPAIPGSKQAKERERFWINHHVQSGNLLTNIAEMDEVKE